MNAVTPELVEQVRAFVYVGGCGTRTERAKTARLVRKSGKRVVQVKKNAALLDDPSAFERMGAALLPSGLSASPLRMEFASVSRAMLGLLYPGPTGRSPAGAQIVWDRGHAVRAGRCHRVPSPGRGRPPSADSDDVRAHTGAGGGTGPPA